MVKTLRAYQEEGADWLASMDRGYLGDAPGVGKTAQSCAAAARVHSKRTLVIAPASSLINWHREWREFGPTYKSTFAAMSYADPRLADLAGLWDVVILDEAHYVKRATAQRTHRALKVAHASPTSWLLSGTPMPNNPYELYAPIKVLWPGVLKDLGISSARQWFDRYCLWRNTQYGPRVYGVQNEAELVDVLSRIMLRRKVEDIDLQLPPLQVDMHFLPSNAEVERIHQADLADATRRRLLGTLKAPEIAQVISEELSIGQYQQIVVFAYSLDALAILRTSLNKYGLQYIDGSVSQGRRQQAIDAFTDDPSNRVMLMQQTSGGVALNLQVSSEVVLAEPSWVPDENYQAIKRIHRFGSVRPCRARIFATVGSRDEAVMSANAQKIRMHHAVSL